MELVNALSWSSSRARTLRRCARLYYLRYYQFWKGWEAEASSPARLAWVLSKMTDLPALVGEVVHLAIARNLHALRDGRVEDPDPDAALAAMRSVWADARRHWAQGPDSPPVSPKRHRPVAEVFYGEANEDPERLKEIAQRAPSSLAAYLGSALLAELRAGEPEALAWVEPVDPGFDERTVLRLDGVAVHCVPDLVRRVDDVVEIVDWKTGQPSPDDADQVAAYGLWAIDKVGADPERLRGRVVYLEQGGRDEVVPIDRTALEAAVARIRDDLTEMTDRLERPEENLPRDRETFARRDDPAVCGRCHYRVFCWPDGLPAAPGTP